MGKSCKAEYFKYMDLIIAVEREAWNGTVSLARIHELLQLLPMKDFAAGIRLETNWKKVGDVL